MSRVANVMKRSDKREVSCTVLTRYLLNSGPGFNALMSWMLLHTCWVQRNEYSSVLLCFTEPEDSLWDFPLKGMQGIGRVYYFQNVQTHNSNDWNTRKKNHSLTADNTSGNNEGIILIIKKSWSER